MWVTLRRDLRSRLASRGRRHGHCSSVLGYWISCSRHSCSLVSSGPRHAVHFAGLLIGLHRLVAFAGHVSRMVGPIRLRLHTVRAWGDAGSRGGRLLALSVGRPDAPAGFSVMAILRCAYRIRFVADCSEWLVVCRTGRHLGALDLLLASSEARPLVRTPPVYDGRRARIPARIQLAVVVTALR